MRIYRRIDPVPAPRPTAVDDGADLGRVLRKLLTSPSETCQDGRRATLVDVLGAGVCGVLREILEQAKRHDERLIDALDNLAASNRGEDDPRPARQEARQEADIEADMARLLRDFGGMGDEDEQPGHRPGCAGSLPAGKGDSHEEGKVEIDVPDAVAG